MSREAHVRFRESVVVKFRRATRRVPRTPKGDAPWEMGVDWPPGIGLQDRIPNYVELPG